MNIDDVVRTHWSPIFYFVLGWVHDREVAAELTQDCFWKACKGWEQFRGESTEYTWLRHIALNTIHTFARNQRIQFWCRVPLHDLSTIEDLLPHPQASAESTLISSERLQKVWRAAGLLPSRQQRAFVLRFGEEMELEEIATAMNISKTAVKVHLFRALQSLKERVNKPQFGRI